MARPVEFFEIATPDPTRSQRFYGGLFGWTFADVDGYALVDGAGIGGGIGPDEGAGASTKVYVRVDDLDAALAKATELGATKVLDPTPLPGDAGTIAMFSDPDGIVVGLWA